MYPSSSLFIAIGQLAIVVLVLVSYPLQVHPCRNCLDKIFHPHPSAAGAQGAHKAIPTSETQAQAAEVDGAEDVEDEYHAVGEMTPLKHAVLTAAIIGGGFTVAYFVNDLRLGEYRRVYVLAKLY
jgi:hypothetical protein